MSVRPDRDIAAATAAHRRLLSAVAGLGDDDITASSRLPGWTVGHVLTHLARNADSHHNAFAGAAQGEVWPRYPGGMVEREAGIAAGFGRPVADQLEDLRTASAALEADWAAATELAWAGRCSGNGGEQPIADLPFLRRRELECHQVDLGLGYEPDQWPEDYAAEELRRGTAALGPLPGDVTELPVQEQAAWLLGRARVDGVESPPQWF